MQMIVLASPPVDVRSDAEAWQARWTASMAEQLTKVLRTHDPDIWPRRTGFSQDRFIVEDVAGSWDLHVLNSAGYAGYVERAAKSPHRGKARRAIERHWEQAAEVADDYAGEIF